MISHFSFHIAPFIGICRSAFGRHCPARGMATPARISFIGLVSRWSRSGGKDHANRGRPPVRETRLLERATGWHIVLARIGRLARGLVSVHAGFCMLRGKSAVRSRRFLHAKRQIMAIADDIASKCVVVTGAGTGIGRGVALKFAEYGADVVLHYGHSDAGAKSAVEEIEAMGRRANSGAGRLQQHRRCLRACCAG